MPKQIKPNEYEQIMADLPAEALQSGTANKEPLPRLLVKEPSPFSVAVTDDVARHSINIMGLGTIYLNRAHEGFIIDVWDETGYECLSSLALEDTDFRTESGVL